MLLLQTAGAVFELALGRLAQSRLGLFGVVSLGTVLVLIRARRTGAAVGAAVVFTFLMLQT